jgi:hypothetical protein
LQLALTLLNCDLIVDIVTQSVEWIENSYDNPRAIALKRT